MSVPRTLSQLFFGAVDRYSTKRAALRHKVGQEWRDITHQELARRVHHAALGLRELGIDAGDRIAILSANRPEWAITDFATLNLGCADVPIYPSLPASQIVHLLRDSGARVVAVSDAEQLEKILEVRSDVPDLAHIVAFDELDADGVVGFKHLMQIGAAATDKYPDYHERALATEPDALATIIYTSGTTGTPKGVMLTHGNLVSDALASLQVLAVGSNDECLSLLPLSHSFERNAGHYIMFHAGVTISYAESIGTAPDNMREIRPTVMISVPRMYEKMFARVLDNAMSGGAAKKRIFRWARRTGEAWADLALAGQAIPATLRWRKRLAHRLVFSKLHQRTGGRLRFFVSGGAPLVPEIAKFFYAAGLPILEGYGLTETSPVICVNPLDAPRIGTVGRPIPGVEVRIADDGEILTRGPNVMKGYYNLPEQTAEVLDAEGWFHTGDIGELDADGYLRITDRKKDLIVTAGGKNIAPQPIENRMKASPFVANAVIIGDKRKFSIVLVVPDADAVRGWMASRNLSAPPGGGITGLPDVVAKIEREVMLTVRDLASFELPKKVLIVEDDFTVENGELTPTLKVKRRVVEEHYRDRIDACYD